LANIVYFSCHDSLLYRSEIDDPLWRSAYLNQSEVMRKVTTQGVALAKSVFNVSEFDHTPLGHRHGCRTRLGTGAAGHPPPQSISF
jgi:hypothetical protein